MTNYKQFETPRLKLRPTSLEDAAFILELVNSPKWLQFVGDRKVKNLKDAERYIMEKIQPQLEKLGYSNYTLSLKENGTKIGVCGLYDRPGLEGVDLGFALLPDFEGKGYAYEAASCLLIVAKEDFGLFHVSAITTYNHTASQKLLSRLGFNLKGMTHIPNDEEELLLFEKLL